MSIARSRRPQPARRSLVPAAGLLLAGAVGPAAFPDEPHADLVGAAHAIRVAVAAVPGAIAIEAELERADEDRVSADPVWEIELARTADGGPERRDVIVCARGGRVLDHEAWSPRGGERRALTRLLALVRNAATDLATASAAAETLVPGARVHEIEFAIEDEDEDDDRNEVSGGDATLEIEVELLRGLRPIELEIGLDAGRTDADATDDDLVAMRAAIALARELAPSLLVFEVGPERRAADEDRRPGARVWSVGLLEPASGLVFEVEVAEDGGAIVEIARDPLDERDRAEIAALAELAPFAISLEEAIDLARARFGGPLLAIEFENRDGRLVIEALVGPGSGERREPARWREFPADAD